MTKNAQWVLHYLKSVEQRGEHAPVETMVRVIAMQDALIESLHNVVALLDATLLVGMQEPAPGSIGGIAKDLLRQVEEE